jgi:hypothetical protein
MTKAKIVLCILITVLTLNFAACTAREAPVIDAPIMDAADLGQIVSELTRKASTFRLTLVELLWCGTKGLPGR